MRAGVCPVAGCDRHPAPAKPFCYAHWFRVPPELQQRILSLRKRLASDRYHGDLWLEEMLDAQVAEAIVSLAPPEPERLE